MIDELTFHLCGCVSVSRELAPLAYAKCCYSVLYYMVSRVFQLLSGQLHGLEGDSDNWHMQL